MLASSARTKSNLLRILESFSDAEAATLLHDWRGFWARPAQLPPPGDWRYWLVQAGRGFGKTRVGAETVREWAESKSRRRIALVAPTSAAARDVMIEGESGIVAICPPWNRPLYEPSKRRLTWPNGVIATAYSAEEPDRLRGPQYDGAWCDELASWRYPDAWDQLIFGLRLGHDPRAVVTTTPKPVALVRDLIADSNTVVTRGSTRDNLANLAPAFLDKIVRKYEGTRLGRQELEGELLDEIPGALWTRTNIDAYRITDREMRWELVTRIVVGIDPAVTSGEDSDETGIICAGRTVSGHVLIFDDASCRKSPLGWAQEAVALMRNRRADRIIAEVNNGGDLVEANIRTVWPNVPFRAVRASRGKLTRAEPVAALYEQGRVHHVGAFQRLEDQLCTYVPDSGERSPDRLDALVWAVTDLVIDLEEIVIQGRAEIVQISPI